MHFPSLVLPQFCKTPIHVVVQSEGVSKDGEPIKAFEADLKCNYQDKVVTVLTDQQKIVKLTGSALFNGDIAPNLSGEVRLRSHWKAQEGSNSSVGADW